MRIETFLHRNFSRVLKQENSKIFVILYTVRSLNCLKMTQFIFYILIREGIRFMQNGTPPPIFVKCPRFETP